MLDRCQPDSKMSNLETITDNFCAIANLKNYIVCAYPNYLVLGKPIKTVTGVKFEKRLISELIVLILKAGLYL